MRAPETLAFEIRLPWPGHKGGIRLIDIWHIDPETDDSDDSCGWTWPPLTEAETAYAARLIDDEHDNIRSFFGDWNETDEWKLEQMRGKVRRLFRLHKHHTRRWWRHPRWHIHHWRVHVVPVLLFKRWAWSRCSACGRRFRWNESPVCTRWDSTGPQWFRSEPDLYHGDCHHTRPAP